MVHERSAAARRLRTATIAVITLAVSSLLAGSVIRDADSEREDPATAQGAGAAAARDRAGDPGGAAPPTSGTKATPPTIGVGGLSDLVVVGGLRTRRLFAMPLDAAIEQAATAPDAPSIPFASLSETVGSPLRVVESGDSLVLATTNVRTLIKVPRLLIGPPAELAISEVVGSGEMPLNYGDLISHGSGAVLVAVGFDTRVAIVRVDVKRFKSTGHVVFDDRYGYPRLCLSQGGESLFVLTSERLDVLDARSLTRKASTQPNGVPAALACVGNQAWVADANLGKGQVFDDHLRAAKDFLWPGGQGTLRLYASPERQSVYGTDPVHGTVFVCHAAGGPCTVSPTLGKKPTDVLVVGDHVLVTLEDSGRVAVVAADDLRPLGSIPFPDSPRTLTLIRRS